MRSLKNVTLLNTVLEDEFKDVELRHFPDPYDRTPNDPMYFLSSEMVIKFANTLASHYDVPPVPKRGGVTDHHLLLLRNYAMALGWTDVYLAGSQLALYAQFGCGEVDLSDTHTTSTQTVRMLVDFSKPYCCALYRQLGNILPVVSQQRVFAEIIGAEYEYINDNRPPVKFIPGDGKFVALLSDMYPKLEINKYSGELTSTVEMSGIHQIALQVALKIPTQPLA